MQTARLVIVGVAVSAAVALAGCTPDRGQTDSDASIPASTLAIPEVTPPPERQTEFCQIMLQLDASLPDDQTVDVTDTVLVAYREALPVAPPEIVSDLEAVIIGLETGAAPRVPATTLGGPDTATAPPVPATSALEPPTPEEAFDAEGYLPDDNPAVRLNEYVDFACRGNLNNPGPPATAPSATPAPAVDEEN